MELDVTLTARCDRPVTCGPISGRLDLAHYRMRSWGDRLSGPRHSRSILRRGVAGGEPMLSGRWPRPRSALRSLQRRRLLLSGNFRDEWNEVWNDVCNEACYGSPLNALMQISYKIIDVCYCSQRSRSMSVFIQLRKLKGN